jgi:hypothetical protein
VSLPALALDHLVVAAATLADGIAWCEATLGVVPEADGRHALMSTHNRVFAIGSAAFPRAYFEIMAVDPDAPPPGRVRWFDLDDAALRAAIAREPQLVHWVARCGDIEVACAGWRDIGIERGEVLDVERDTPQGQLRWRISVRSDGARLFRGALPTLIEWGDVHPADALPASGVTLAALCVAGLPEMLWPSITSGPIRCVSDGPPLVATLSTPRGRVVLQAPFV